MGTDYIHWNPNIKNNDEIISAINDLKNKPMYNNAISTKMTNEEKKEKGEKYELYVANYFRNKGYTVWEHGKEKGIHDKGIDLFIKKDKYIYFIQCKNWETWKIDEKHVKSTRTDVREYLKTKKEFWNLIKNYELKILYVTAKECLTPSAYTYIKENNNIVEYQVIPIK